MLIAKCFRMLASPTATPFRNFSIRVVLYYYACGFYSCWKTIRGFSHVIYRLRRRNVSFHADQRDRFNSVVCRQRSIAHNMQRDRQLNHTMEAVAYLVPLSMSVHLSVNLPGFARHQQPDRSRRRGVPWTRI